MIYIRGNNPDNILIVIFVIVLVWELDVVDIYIEKVDDTFNHPYIMMHIVHIN